MPEETSQQKRSRIERSHQHMADAIESLNKVNALGVITISPSSLTTLKNKKAKVREQMKIPS